MCWVHSESCPSSRLLRYLAGGLALDAGVGVALFCLSFGIAPIEVFGGGPAGGDGGGAAVLAPTPPPDLGGGATLPPGGLFG